jgi:hypothetical protein
MANQLVTLLDITKRKGNDQAINVLEDTITHAPELSALMGRPIPGTQYKTLHRSLPTVAFRQANAGSDTVKGKYRQSLHECFIIDAQMQADKAVVDASAPSSPDSPQADIGDLLFDEAQGVVMGTYIAIGSQLYYGTSNDTNGFTGIQSLTPSLNAAKNQQPVVITAAGATSSVQSSCYLVWENLRGAHFIFGNNSGLTMLPEWRIQQVLGTNSKPLTAYVNNLQGWIGFAVNHPLSVARIANIQVGQATLTSLTDALVAQMLSFIPLQMRSEVIAHLNTGGPNKFGPGLKLFMNPMVAYTLQASRSPTSSGTGTAITASDELKFAQLPLASNGIPIVYTDSITNTEAVVTA